MFQLRHHCQGGFNTAFLILSSSSPPNGKHSVRLIFSPRFCQLFRVEKTFQCPKLIFLFICCLRMRSISLISSLSLSCSLWLLFQLLIAACETMDKQSDKILAKSRECQSNKKLLFSLFLRSSVHLSLSVCSVLFLSSASLFIYLPMLQFVFLSLSLSVGYILKHFRILSE